MGVKKGRSAVRDSGREDLPENSTKHRRFGFKSQAQFQKKFSLSAMGSV